MDLEVGGRRAGRVEKSPGVTAVASQVCDSRSTDQANEQDEKQEYNLDICSEDEPPTCQLCWQEREAEGYCQNCKEFLCNKCCIAHVRTESRRDHIILDKTHMPGVAVQSRDMCAAHPGMPLEYYCNAHNQIQCHSCIPEHHSSCTSLYFIPGMAFASLVDGGDLNILYQELKRIEHSVEQSKRAVEVNVAAIEQCKSNAKSQVNDLKNKMYKLVDKLVEDMYEDIEDIGDSDKKKIDAVSEEYDALVSGVGSMRSELDVKKNSQNTLKLFTAMKTAGESIKEFNNQLTQSMSRNKINIYNFEPEHLIIDMLENEQKLGRLKSKSSVDAFAEDLHHVSAVNTMPQAARTMHETMKASKCAEINAKSGKDRINTTRITGSMVIGDDQLVIADFDNRSVKLLSLSSQQSVVSHLPLSKGPWDITKLANKDTLAVTCPEGQHIQLVAVSKSGTLSLGRKIPVELNCHGIEYSGKDGGKLVVSCTKPAKVKVINLFGAVLQDLSVDSAGKPLFQHPAYIALSADGEIVYVSDREKHTVTAMAMDGTVSFIYQDGQLNFPTGMAVSDNGMIFVCGCRSSNIHVISSSGKKRQVLLGKKDGLKFPPYSVTYNNKQQKIFVGMVGNSNIHVFRLN